MEEKNEIKLDKIYESKKIEEQPTIKYDKNSKKRPSWVKIKLDKKVIFIKILCVIKEARLPYILFSEY